MTISSNRAPLAGAVGLALALWTTGAAAQPEPSATEAARVLYVEGKDLRRAGDLSLSLEKLEAAHALYATPITTLECARAHALVGHLRRAIALLESIGELPVKPSESTKASEARAEATELAAQYRARLGTLRFASIPASAQIVVDAEELPAASRDGFRVDPGAHHVTVDDQGVRTVLDVAVDEGQARDVALPSPPPPAPTPIPPPAPVAAAAPAPVPPASGPAGSHRTWAYVGFGVGAAGVATGAVTGVMTLTRASSLKSECPGGTCLPSSHLPATQALGTVSTVAFAVGGAGLLVGAGALVLGGRDPSTTAAVRAVVGLGLGHIGVTGAF